MASELKDEKASIKIMADQEANVAGDPDDDGQVSQVHDFAENVHLKRGLKQRHIQMIALAGTIGTGLFLTTGKALARGGPVGAVLAYSIIGVLIAFVVTSMAEMSALVPLSGGVVRPAEYFFDPALAFAQGWNTVYATAMLLPAEMVASAVIIDFWISINNAVWITVLGALLIVSNFFFVRIYGELEFFFAILKILLVVGSILMGICIDVGASPSGHVYGFQFWKDPGPFVQYLGIDGSWGQFLGFWRVLASASYAYSNVENFSVAAGETANPRRNIPKAAKRVFWRILIFYFFSIFVISLIVPSNDKDISSSSGDAASSPYVVAATRVGIKVVPHIINAIVLTSAWSAGNSAMLGGTRILYGLANDGHAPKIFLRTNRYGIPWVATAGISVFMLLGYMTLDSGAATVFEWFQDLVSAASFVHWINIEIVYLRFYYGCKKQGIDRKELPWKGPLQPYGAWLALIGFSLLLLTGGFTVFIKGQWDTQTFVSNYFNIPLIFYLYFGYKFWKKTKIVPLDELPIRHFLEIAKNNPEPLETPKKGWKKLNFLWG
ncbi:hypothetical protein K431DRAFT_252458 [Polychaeton citri CBS 116435]|uniref:Amino acid permease/ SLC12A domain-containing protein n=1 Tax=Polychaeton citri CBS 116435 TaxID=1314669 RepID=A0A9P4Q1D7_9PEZI|nr:hypothetical protein K431DRAFT_252458 [Polychaeton citri CBS 116435]